MVNIFYLEIGIVGGEGGTREIFSPSLYPSLLLFILVQWFGHRFDFGWVLVYGPAKFSRADPQLGEIDRVGYHQGRKEDDMATRPKTEKIVKKRPSKKVVRKTASRKAAKAPLARRKPKLGATVVRADEHAQNAKDSLASAALMVRRAKDTITTDCPKAMEMLAQALFHQGAAAAHIEQAVSAGAELDRASQIVKSEIKATLDAVKLRCAIPAR